MYATAKHKGKGDYLWLIREHNGTADLLMSRPATLAKRCSSIPTTAWISDPGMPMAMWIAPDARTTCAIASGMPWAAVPPSLWWWKHLHRSPCRLQRTLERFSFAAFAAANSGKMTVSVPSAVQNANKKLPSLLWGVTAFTLEKLYEVDNNTDDDRGDAQQDADEIQDLADLGWAIVANQLQCFGALNDTGNVEAAGHK